MQVDLPEPAWPHKPLQTHLHRSANDTRAKLACRLARTVNLHQALQFYKSLVSCLDKPIIFIPPNRRYQPLPPSQVEISPPITSVRHVVDPTVTGISESCRLMSKLAAALLACGILGLFSTGKGR